MLYVVPSLYCWNIADTALSNQSTSKFIVLILNNVCVTSACGSADMTIVVSKEFRMIVS